MGLRAEIREALSTGNKDAMQLLAACPSAKSLAHVTRNMAQLAHEGKILRTEEERRYTLTRSSGRTRAHDKVTKLYVCSLGRWPSTAPQRAAENMPFWLVPASAR